MSTGLLFNVLRSINLTRCARWHPGGVKAWDANRWAVAVMGEFGEACNLIKKLNRDEDGIIGNDKSAFKLKAELVDELADTLIYLDLLAARLDIDLGEAVRNKFNKTSQKHNFPDRL